MRVCDLSVFMVVMANNQENRRDCDRCVTKIGGGVIFAIHLQIIEENIKTHKHTLKQNDSF